MRLEGYVIEIVRPENRYELFLPEMERSKEFEGYDIVVITKSDFPPKFGIKRLIWAFKNKFKVFTKVIFVKNFNMPSGGILSIDVEPVPGKYFVAKEKI